MNSIIADEKSELTQIDFLMLSNYIINECTKKYYNEYIGFQVPLTYIEFYFHIVSNYRFLFNRQFEEYFEKLESKPNMVEYLARVFSKTFSEYCQIQEIRNRGKHLVMAKKFFPLSISFDSEAKQKLDQTLLILKKIVDNIFYNEEERSLKQQYIDYMKNKLEKKLSLSKKPVEETPKQGEKIHERTAPKSSPPSKSANVTRVIIPRYKLPSEYPISFTKSRVDSQHVANKFFSSVKLIELLLKFDVSGVTYGQDFIVKRRSLFKPKQKKFSDFF